MRKISFKLVIALLLVLQCNLNSLKAQKTDFKLTESVSQDSLIFMIYGNLNKIISGPLKNMINDKLPYELKDVLSLADEFCFYANSSTIYDCYTLRFEKSKNASALNTDSLFQTLQLTKTSEDASYIKLNGDNYKKGFLRIDGNQYILKLYVQTGAVDEEIREKTKVLMKEFSDDYFANEELSEQFKQLEKADSVNSVRYFDELIDKEMKMAEHEVVKNPVNAGKIFGDDMAKSSGIAFFDAKKISELPFLLYQSMNYDFMKMYEMINSMGGICNYYDRLWLSFQQEQNQILITSIADSKEKMNLYRKLDDDILCRLPAERGKMLLVYNLNLADLKNYVIKYFSSTEYRDKQRIAVKLAALAIDDDILNSFGDGSLAVMDGKWKGRDIPDFKLTLKMPNKEKAGLLLNILCDDVKFFKKERDNLYTLSNKYARSDKKIYLVVDNDIWMLGTGEVDSLKMRLTKSQIHDIYPELDNKRLSQYFSMDVEALSRYEKDLKSINVQTEMIDKTRVKTVVELSVCSDED